MTPENREFMNAARAFCRAINARWPGGQRAQERLAGELAEKASATLYAEHRAAARLRRAEHALDAARREKTLATLRWAAPQDVRPLP